MDTNTVAQPDPREERLAALEDRHRNELMDHDQRCEIWSRIARARAELSKAKG